MTLGKTIHKIRTEAKLTQEQFSQIFGISQQSVQKWESDASTPDLDKIIMISKYFDVSLDALILGNDNRVVDEMKKTKVIKPHYKNIHDWEFYSSNLLLEYQESIDEGLDIFISKLQEKAESNEYLNKLKEQDNYEEIKEALAPNDYNMIVTPKEIDDLIENMKALIARGINYAV